MLQRWKILQATHPIHQIWCHCPRSRCLHHTYCIPGSSSLDTLQKHRRKLGDRRMYNPLVTRLPINVLLCHQNYFYKTLFVSHLIKAFQSLPCHYLLFRIWPQPVYQPHPLPQPFPSITKFISLWKYFILFHITVVFFLQRCWPTHLLYLENSHS